MQALELGKSEAGKIEDKWEKLCDISWELAQMSSEDTLCLPLNVAFAKQYKKGDTVATVLERAVQDARTIHLPPLQKEIGQANVKCWVLVRVGMSKILWQRVA